MKAVIIAGLAASLLSLPTAAGESGTVKAWGVPTPAPAPFQRELVQMTAADAARMEIILEAEEFWATEFSGRPPMGLGFQQVPVTGAASVQPELDTRNYTPIQSKPLLEESPL